MFGAGPTLGLKAEFSAATKPRKEPYKLAPKECIAARIVPMALLLQMHFYTGLGVRGVTINQMLVAMLTKMKASEFTVGRT